MSKHNFTLHHSSMLVADTQESLKFYRDILGMEQTTRPDLAYPGAWLKVGEQQVHLIELPNPDPITGRPPHGGRDRHVAMHVDSIDALKADLDQAEISYTLSVSGRKALFCRDRDGNALEFIERSS